MANDQSIAAVDPLPGQLALLVTWRDGASSQVDLTEFIDTYTVLTPLRELSFFVQVQVGEWGFDVAWPNDIQLAASTLRRLITEQAICT